jgi:hypothetical protein
MLRVLKDVHVSSIKLNGVRDPAVTSLTCVEQYNILPFFFGVSELSFSNIDQ